MKPPLTHLGEFRLDVVIQDGPYAMAVKGYQPSLRRPVFIKLLKPHIRQQQQWLTRFRREAQICADLKSPYIVDVYTVGEQEGYFYLVQEFVDGQSLDKTLEQRQKLPLGLALDIARQATLALQAAHERKIIHRDLKPGNILVDRNGHAKLTDFGMAHLGEETTITRQDSIIGTPAYMAPEQITGEALTPATDFFALGATLYEMLTGVKPFDGDNYSACLQRIMNETPPPPSRRHDRIPAAVDELVLKLLEKEPHQRPQKAGDILEQIESIISQTSIKIKDAADFFPGEKTADEETVAPKADNAPPESRRRLLFWGAASLFVAMLAGVAFFTFKQSPQSMHLPTEKMASISDSTKASSPDSLEKVTPQIDEQRRFVKRGESEPAEISTHTIAQQEKAFTAEASAFAAQDTTATLHIRVQPWANISIDGRVLDSLATVFDGRLRAGTYRLALTHPEFSPKIFPLNLRAGAADTIIYTFYEQAAWLDINVRPWAEVYIDGKYIDSTPLKRLIVVESGSHLVELKNPYFQTFRTLVQTTAGDTVVIQQVLRE